MISHSSTYVSHAAAPHIGARVLALLRLTRGRRS